MTRSAALSSLVLSLLCAGVLVPAASAFVAPPAASAPSTCAAARSQAVPSCPPLRSTAADETSATETTDDDSDDTKEDSNSDALGLTPELRKITDAFASIPDEKMRYKQLLYMAQQLPPVEPSVAVPENKVPGCLSTVYVFASPSPTYSDDGTVTFVGDSDGLLTKGLVALLVRGLSGCTPEQIATVDAEFINAAKISQSLTPGRNNGFLNMLAVMKRKAAELADGGGGEAAAAQDDASAEASDGDGDIITTFDQREGKPMYNEIMSKLIAILKPTSITLTDNSDQHAGHAGSKGWEESGESHFALEIVSEAFGGLAAVKRHQLVYMLLGETMEKIHALQISAKTPEEMA